MSHWGFPQTDDPIWRDHYDRLTERERSFFCNGLPQILRAVHVGVVCRRSIPYIVDRLYQFEPNLYDYLSDLVSSEARVPEPTTDDVEDYLIRFAGFYLLIPTYTNDEYARVLSEGLMSMGVATHKRLTHWDISDIREEVQEYHRRADARIE